MSRSKGTLESLEGKRKDGPLIPILPRGSRRANAADPSVRSKHVSLLHTLVASPGPRYDDMSARDSVDRSACQRRPLFAPLSLIGAAVSCGAPPLQLLLRCGCSPGCNAGRPDRPAVAPGMVSLMCQVVECEGCEP